MPKQTHKQDVIRFCEWRAKLAENDMAESDRTSKSLLWKLIALMVRLNGQLVGTDIAELLLEGFEGIGGETKSSVDESEYSITSGE